MIEKAAAPDGQEMQTHFVCNAKNAFLWDFEVNGGTET